VDSLLAISGSLALGPGGSLLTTGAGAPCCCAGGCDSYFRAPACGTAGPCPLIPADIYVCASAWLATTCPGVGQGAGVVGVGGQCYRVEDTGEPIPRDQLPTGAFTYDGPNFDCLPDCSGCTIPNGFYQIRFCACRDIRPGQADINAVISCNCEWQNRAAGMRCPTYNITAPNGTTFCVQADLFAPLVSAPPGTDILCAAAGDGCCACCNGFNTGGCGTYFCQSWTQQFPGQRVYGPVTVRCCGERFSRVGRRDYFRTIANPPFPNCVVNEEHWTWDMDPADPATWYVRKQVINRDPFGCAVIDEHVENVPTQPFCNSTPTTQAASQSQGSASLTCLIDGWAFRQDSIAGNLSGGLTHDVIREDFKVVLGVCGGPCEDGESAGQLHVPGGFVFEGNTIGAGAFL
jgi:hypothetical protein